MGSKAWDKRSWRVTCPGRKPFTTVTSEGATWALRALMAAGQKGLYPTDGAEGRFGLLVGHLRGLGIEIEALQSDEHGRRGFVLACQVAAVRT